MSQIDLAFRRAQKNAHGVSGAFSPTEPEARAIDRATLETYATEGPGVEQVKPVELHPQPPRVKPVGRHPQLPVAPVPSVRTSVRGRVTESPSWRHNKLVVSRDLNPVSAEQYRRLAGSLHGLQAERGVKTLMVSSAVPKEGKTLTVTNLALTFSESYNRRVLVIDCDLRRPAIHDVFGLSNDFGLADAIREGSQSLPLTEVAPRLAVLTAGKMDAAAPTAELASEQLRVFIEQVSAQFDWVLLDTPPAGVFPDAKLVARVADAILFVVGAGLAPYDVVQRSLAELGDKVIGTVLNRVDERSLTAADYYGSGYKSTTRDWVAR
jgi:capsular exopolysaccharide synthesis family protein